MSKDTSGTTVIWSAKFLLRLGLFLIIWLILWLYSSIQTASIYFDQCIDCNYWGSWILDPQCIASSAARLGTGWLSCNDLKWYRSERPYMISNLTWKLNWIRELLQGQLNQWDSMKKLMWKFSYWRWYDMKLVEGRPIKSWTAVTCIHNISPGSHDFRRRLSKISG